MANANWTRINIVVDPNKYRDLWKPFARDNYHGNFSQLVRAAMDDLINRSRNEAGIFELRPVLEHLDKLEDRMAEVVDAIKGIEERTDVFCSINELSFKKLLDDVLKILEQADRPLFTEDVCEKLQRYTIDMVRTALEWLADREFAIEQIPPSGEGKTMWKFLGCKK